MNRKPLLVLTLSVLLAFSAPTAFAGEALAVRNSDNVSDVLKSNIGKSVEGVLVSGERSAGKIETVAATVVHISRLGGMDSCDAVVEDRYRGSRDHQGEGIA